MKTSNNLVRLNHNSIQWTYSMIATSGFSAVAEEEPRIILCPCSTYNQTQSRREVGRKMSFGFFFRALKLKDSSCLISSQQSRVCSCLHLWKLSSLPGRPWSLPYQCANCPTPLNLSRHSTASPFHHGYR